MAIEGEELIRRRGGREDIVPRSPWGPLRSDPVALLDDMDRVFDDFRTDWERLFASPRIRQGIAVRPPLTDLSDTGVQYVVKAEVPGICKEELSIEVTDVGIEISGETSSETEEGDAEKGYVRRERSYARFHRTLPFPEKVLPDEADASLKDGILTVTVPKAAKHEKTVKKLTVE